jgi:hypothetical protein
MVTRPDASAVAEVGEEHSSELLGLFDRVWFPADVHPVTVAAC